MRKGVVSIQAVIWLVGALAGAVSAQTLVQVTTAFSPVEDVTNPPIVVEWENAIAQATQSIRITLYSFTSQRVKNALAQAAAGGIQVRAILDSSLLHNCLAYDLYDVGVTFKIYQPSCCNNIMHHKFLVVDQNLVATGSANFTTAAQQYNHENQSFFRYLSGPRAFFDDYINQFEAMWKNQFTFNGTFTDWQPEPGYCGR